MTTIQENKLSEVHKLCLKLDNHVCGRGGVLDRQDDQQEAIETLKAEAVDRRVQLAWGFGFLFALNAISSAIGPEVWKTLKHLLFGASN